MTNRRSSATAQAIHREILDLTAYLVEIGFVDNQRYPEIVYGARKAWIVNLAGPKHHFGLKKEPYEEIYWKYVAAQCYNMLLLDGAMVQLHYEGIGTNIVKHRLAYLPSPSLRPYQDDPELYFLEQHFVDIVGYQVVPVPIRYDFDNTAGTPVDVIHPVSHLTLGQYKHCRIPVTGPMPPRIFVEFILHNFYSTPGTDRISLKAYAPRWEETITDAERTNVHCCVGKH